MFAVKLENSSKQEICVEILVTPPLTVQHNPATSNQTKNLIHITDQSSPDHTPETDVQIFLIPSGLQEKYQRQTWIPKSLQWKQSSLYFQFSRTLHNTPLDSLPLRVIPAFQVNLRSIMELRQHLASTYKGHIQGRLWSLCSLQLLCPSLH